MTFFILCMALMVLGLAELRAIVERNNKDRKMNAQPKRCSSRPALDVSQLFNDTANDRIKRAREYLTHAKSLTAAARGVLRGADVPKMGAFVQEAELSLDQALTLADEVIFDAPSATPVADLAHAIATDDVHDRDTIRMAVRR